MGPLMRMKTHNINSLVLRSRPDPRVRRKAPLTTPEGYAHPFPPHGAGSMAPTVEQLPAEKRKQAPTTPSTRSPRGMCGRGSGEEEQCPKHGWRMSSKEVKAGPQERSGGGFETLK